MITYRQLSRPLRLAVVTPWCLLLGLLASAEVPTTFWQLTLDPDTRRPATLVNLSGPNWTGTLDPAHLPADPVAGRDTAPASVSASGAIQTGFQFATDTGGFIANDTGVYLGGFQIADPYGTLFALNRLQTPVVYVQAVSFADDSRLQVTGNQLVWTDANGNDHVLTIAF